MNKTILAKIVYVVWFAGCVALGLMIGASMKANAEQSAAVQHKE